MKKAPYLSVVIPAYNEEENIKKGVLKSVIPFLKSKSYTWEILIVDDGSVDKTVILLEDYVKKNKNVSLIKNPHHGKAGAVSRGVHEARGKFILFTDFDQATPINELDRLLAYFPKYDIVIGSRAGRRKGAPLSRLIMARGFMILKSLLLGITVEDTQCGFKAFTNDKAQILFKKLRLYKRLNQQVGSRVTAGFDVELLFLARKLGYSVKEVPVEWHYVETRRVNPIRDSIDGLKDLLRIKLLDLQGNYDR